METGYCSTYSVDVLQFLSDVFHAVLDLGKEVRGPVSFILALVTPLPGILKVGLELLKHLLTSARIMAIAHYVCTAVLYCSTRIVLNRYECSKNEFM